jgi:hypothetical protein
MLHARRRSVRDRGAGYTDDAGYEAFEIKSNTSRGTSDGSLEHHLVIRMGLPSLNEAAIAEQRQDQL